MASSLVIRYALALLLATLSLVCAIVVFTTRDVHGVNFPVYLIWLTLSAAMVYIALCAAILHWVHKREKWSGSQVDFEHIQKYTVDSRSSSEIDKDEWSLTSSNESLRAKAQVAESFLALPEPAVCHTYAYRTAPLPPLPLPSVSSTQTLIHHPTTPNLDLTVPSPTYLRGMKPRPRPLSPAGLKMLNLKLAEDPHQPSLTKLSINSIVASAIPSDAFLLNDYIGMASKVSVVKSKASKVEIKKSPSREHVKKQTKNKVAAMRDAFVREAVKKDLENGEVC